MLNTPLLLVKLTVKDTNIMYVGNVKDNFL
jgi:hypothetical protein